MGTSAYLLRKSAPAAGEPLGLMKRQGKTLLNWPSPCLPCPVERATGRPRICFANTHRLRSADLVCAPARAKRVGLDVPEVPCARWSGQRDIRVFASQIRTGFRRLPAPSPARYKRFAFALRSHPVGFESRHFIEKSTAPERCRAFTFSGAGNGTRTRECQLGKLMPYHLAMPAYVGDSITRLSCSIQG